MGRRRGPPAGGLRECLLELAAGDPAPAALDELWTDPDRAEVLLDAAEEHGLSSTLHDALVERGHDAHDELVELRRGATARRLAAWSTLRRWGAAMDRAEIPWLACKGPVVAARHERPEHREFNDLDLLVPGPRLREALAVAEEAGIRSINRNWEPFVRFEVGEIPLVDGDVWIDLHWHLVGLGELRRGLRIDPAAMLARRRRLRLDGDEVSVFGAEDEVLHLALHAGLGGGGRLAWLRDLRVVIAAGAPDWDVLVREARRARIATITGQVLDRARLLAGAAVPADVAAQLVPRPLLSARRRWDEAPVDDEVLVRRVGAGAVVHLPRDDLRTTVGVCWRTARGRLGTVVRRPHRWDVADPEGTLYWGTPSGDSSTFERYLAVAARS